MPSATQKWSERKCHLEGQNILNTLTQKSKNIPVSQTEEKPTEPSLETLPTPQRNEVSPLDFTRVPIFEEYR
jgi:hypothetical protein